jgi:Tfp pilus assembly protein FimT
MTRKSGYTLVELLVAAVLAVALLGISAAGYHTWVRSTSGDASATLLLAELTRARAYSLARCCPTRVTVFTGDRGDTVLSERLDVENGKDWYAIARTNRLPWVHVSHRRIFFRPDGSCCTNADFLAEEADFAEYAVELEGKERRANEEPPTWRILIDARTGLATEGRE